MRKKHSASSARSRRSKNHPARKKTRTKTRTPRKAKAKAGRRTPILQTPPPTPAQIPGFKTCEEPEVGDIGGFGDVDAFESHEKQCGEKATEFCATCNKNLCGSHYELMHREHNAGGQHLTEHSMSQ